ncbi:hypothetical protein G9A89_009131 [Geosiphon pyriformis]|nr:hypothetical protein G9A89_009131 [Geosiphon pyriformis]
MYGITQNAETLEYGIVMEFAEHGDMRKYLSTNFHSTGWSNKLDIASHIALGLDSIHSSGMVHRDLHSGNILQPFINRVDIGDLGLCQPVNHTATTTEEKKIYGVIPYIPPEVLKGETFTTAGDIYSLGMILWELATGKPPFYDCSHDHILIMAILNGQRPMITFPLIPPLIAEIIVKCWDFNPKNRPTAREVWRKLWKLREVYDEKSKTKRAKVKQFLESDKYVTEILKNDSTTTNPTHIHPGAVYTSRLLTAQMPDFSKGLVYLPEDEYVKEMRSNDSKLIYKREGIESIRIRFWRNLIRQTPLKDQVIGFFYTTYVGIDNYKDGNTFELSDGELHKLTFKAIERIDVEEIVTGTKRVKSFSMKSLWIFQDF